MKGEQRSGRHAPPRRDPDIEGVLDALTGEELGSFVRDILEGLDDELRSAFLDSLISRAARGSSGWKPSGPCQQRAMQEHDLMLARRGWLRRPTIYLAAPRKAS